MKRYRILSTLLTFCLLLCGLGLWVLLKTPEEYSPWERRKLAQPPRISAASLLSGGFSDQAETYLADQFPLRQEFRVLKATAQRRVFLQKDVDGYYTINGNISRLDPELNEVSLANACEKLTALYRDDLAPNGSRAFYCVVPDKNRYLAGPNGYPTLDYEALYAYLEERLPMEGISIDGLLTAEDYYATDTHWRQEKLTDVADAISNALGIGPSPAYETLYAGEFLGVYAGQSALPVQAEPLYFLTNEELENCTVKELTFAGGSYTMQPLRGIYDLQDFAGRDPYDIFLSGASPLLTIENPAGDPEKELLIFRDSFGSSLAPLLVHGYSRVTVIDTRYIAPEQLDEYIDFHGQDALFVYSTLLLNSSQSLK